MNRAERRRRQKQGAKKLGRDEAEQLFHDADTHLAAGNINAAIQCYRQLQKAEPDNAEVLNMLGVLAGQDQGDFSTSQDNSFRTLSFEGPESFLKVFDSMGMNGI